MNPIPGNIPGGGTAVDVNRPNRPRTLDEQIVLDNDGFYDVNGGGFGTIASYQTKGHPAVYIRGIYERKPVISDMYGQMESYVLTFRSPNAEVSGAQQGAMLVINRKGHFVTHVEKDSNGDTILTLSQNDYANASTPTNR